MIWFQKVYLHLEWTLPKEMQKNGLVDVIITRLRWTYTDQSVKLCYRSKYSDLVPAPQQKSRKCKVRIDPESHSFLRLYEVLCYHALESTDPALEDALTYMQLIYPLSRTAWKLPIFRNSVMGCHFIANFAKSITNNSVSEFCFLASNICFSHSVGWIEFIKHTFGSCTR